MADASAQSPLDRAVRVGDADGVRAALAAGAPSREALQRALVRAVAVGSIPAVGLLLDHGADVNGRDERSGWPPLLYAIEHRRGDVVAYLLDRGADPNLGTSDGWTPLHHAVDVEGDDHSVATPDQRTAESTALLPARGADAHAANARGATPLGLAECYRHEAAIRVLGQNTTPP